MGLLNCSYLVRVLEQLDVTYLVTGSTVTIVYGEPRFEVLPRGVKVRGHTNPASGTARLARPRSSLGLLNPGQWLPASRDSDFLARLQLVDQLRQAGMRFNQKTANAVRQEKPCRTAFAARMPNGKHCPPLTSPRPLPARD